MAPYSDKIFIVWAPYCGRAKGLADILGLQLHFTYSFGFKKALLAPFKYPIQALQTLNILARGRPNLVFVQNPPIFATVIVWLFSRLMNYEFVVDSHSGAFVSSKWKWSLIIHQLISRRAIVTLVTNRQLYSVVRGWSAEVMVVHDVPLEYPSLTGRQQDDSFQVFIPCGFGNDEMIDKVLSAANMCPEVKFLLSGDEQYLSASLRKSAPANVAFTGWLSDTKYRNLLHESNAVLTLTTEEHTLLRGAWEAMYAGRPLITSNRKTLREYYTEGTLFVEDTVESIASGVEKVIERQKELQAQMKSLRQDKMRVSQNQIIDLMRLCGLSDDYLA